MIYHYKIRFIEAGIYNAKVLGYKQYHSINVYIVIEMYIFFVSGRIQYEKKIIPEEIDSNGNILIPQYALLKPLLNPKYDNKQKYIPRSSRQEWVSIALIGQVKVRDDGSCLPGDFCIPNNDGIATKSSSNTGYKVLKRTGDNQLLILFR